MRTPRNRSDSAESDNDSALAKRRRRTKTGCLTCRQRKVKCDERSPVCVKCERVGLSCRWSSSAGNAPSAEARSSVEVAAQELRQSTRSRPIPCHACRVARCKCTAERPACERCRDHGILCDYNPDKPGPTVLIDVTPSTPLENVSPRDLTSTAATPDVSKLESLGDASALYQKVGQNQDDKDKDR